MRQIALFVAGALILILLLKNMKPKSDTTGEARPDYRLRWISATGQEKDVIGTNEVAQHHLRVFFERPLRLALHAAPANSKEIRELVSKWESNGSGQKDLDFPLETLNGIERICILGARDEAAFIRDNERLASIWPTMNTGQCVSIHFGS